MLKIRREKGATMIEYAILLCVLFLMITMGVAYLGKVTHGRNCQIVIEWVLSGGAEITDKEEAMFGECQNVVLELF